MEKASEKAIRHRERRPAGDEMRRNVIVLAATLLLLVFPPILHNVSNKPLLVVAFLIPALQISWALYEFDEIRRSLLVVQQSIILDTLSFLLSIAMFLLTFSAEPSPEAWLLVSCVYIIWVFLFELGLGFATKLQLPNFYSSLSVNLAIGVAKASGTEMSPAFWAMTLAPVPLTTLLMLISWKYGKTMFLADPPAAEAEIVRE